MKIKRLILLLLWILSLVGISYFGGSVSYVFFFTITLYPIVSLIFLLICIQGIKVHQNLSNRTSVCGEKTDYSFVLQNDTVISFPCVEVKYFPDNYTIENVSTQTGYELLPKEKIEYTTSLTCKYRGEYPVGMRSLLISDPLGIFRLNYKLPSTLKAIVLPRVTTVDELKSLENIPLITGQSSSNINDIVDTTTREYIPGDDIKFLHHKVTAKTGSLMMRQLCDERKSQISIYCDKVRLSQNPNDYLPAENKLLEILLSVCSFFSYKSKKISICHNFPTESISSVREFDTFYQSVASYYFTSSFDELSARKDFIDSCIENDIKIAVFVVQVLDTATILASEKLVNLGIYSIFYVVDQSPNTNIFQYQNDLRQIIAISPNDDLKALL